MKELAGLLKKAEVLGELTWTERVEISRRAVRKILDRGEILCVQGDHWPFVLYLSSGVLESVIHSPDGRNYTGAMWESGDVLWGHTIFDDSPAPATIQAMRSSTVFQWNGDVVLEMLIRNYDAVRALLRRQAQLLRMRRNALCNIVFNPVAGRLANLLLECFDLCEGEPVKRDLTLEEMASMLATSPEAICRILYQFQSRGIMDVNRESITLLNRKALEKMQELV